MINCKGGVKYFGIMLLLTVLMLIIVNVSGLGLDFLRAIDLSSGFTLIVIVLFLIIALLMEE